MTPASAFLSLAAALWLLALLLFASGLRQSLATRSLRLRTQPLSLRVAEVREQAGVTCLLLASAGWWPRLLPPFSPGQAIALRHPSGTLRRYSLAGWQRRPLAYELAIKREPGGLVSNWVAGLQAGTRLEVEQPAGKFGWPASLDGELLLVAGGIGITPLRAMVQRWQALPVDERPACTLVWSVREAAQLLHYDAEFRALAAEAPDFSYRPWLSGEHGRMTLADILACCQTPEPHGLWICAGSAMMDTLHAAWLATGQDPARWHQENFGAGANSDTTRYEIDVQPLGRTVEFQGQPSLLAALLQAEVPIAYDCRNGSCGSCTVQVLAGDCTAVLTPERAPPAGHVLACCTVPRSDMRLTLLATGKP